MQESLGLQKSSLPRRKVEKELVTQQLTVNPDWSASCCPAALYQAGLISAHQAHHARRAAEASLTWLMAPALRLASLGPTVHSLLAQHLCVMPSPSVASAASSGAAEHLMSGVSARWLGA